MLLLVEIYGSRKKKLSQISILFRIAAHTRTFEEIVRREYRQSEGDTFNQSNLKIFKRNINKLNIFKSFEIVEEPISDELIDINVEVDSNLSCYVYIY